MEIKPRPLQRCFCVFLRLDAAYLHTWSIHHTQDRWTDDEAGRTAVAAHRRAPLGPECSAQPEACRMERVMYLQQ